MKHASSLVALTLATAFLAAACSKDEDVQDPSNVQPGYGQYPQGQYPQTAPGQYPQTAPGQYPQTAPGQYPQQPATPATAASPLALPCQSDGGVCGTHKCNLTTQKCAFPCAAPTDCMDGFTCMAGVCLPGTAP